LTILFVDTYKLHASGVLLQVSCTSNSLLMKKNWKFLCYIPTRSSILFIMMSCTALKTTCTFSVSVAHV